MLFRSALKAAGAERIFADKITGSARSRPELDRLLDQLRQGDVITVTKYDRLARSLRDLLDIVDTIQMHGAGFRSLAEDIDTTTPAGRLVIDPSFDYTSSSTNRLVFRGIELVPGIQIGLIEASDADRDTIVTTLGLRYGLTNRLELEARIPALYRWDRIEVAQQRDEGIVRTIKLKERDIGDIEFALRYQLNRPKGQNPIWVANLRVKSDTGKSPFDVGYDEFGVATGLSTGSGFWAVQPSVNFLLPSDPAVIFGSLGWFAGGIGARLQSQPALAVWLDRCAGTIFFALALHLATASR